MSKYIELELLRASKSGKTKVWLVQSKVGGDVLGVMRWKAQWRRYALFPVDGTMFDADCLREIADICEFKTKEHKCGS